MVIPNVSASRSTFAPIHILPAGYVVSCADATIVPLMAAVIELATQRSSTWFIAMPRRTLLMLDNGASRTSTGTSSILSSDPVPCDGRSVSRYPVRGAELRHPITIDWGSGSPRTRASTESVASAYQPGRTTDGSRA